MKAFVAVLALAAGLVAAQDANTLAQAGFPPCAFKCILEGATKSGCPAGDVKCLCSEKSQSAITACMAAANPPPCQPDDIAKARTAGETVCKAAGGEVPKFSGTPGAPPPPPAGGSAAPKPTASNLPSAPSAPKAQASNASSSKSGSIAAPTNAAGGLLGLIGAAAVMAL